MTTLRRTRWRCQCQRGGMSALCRMPPSPEVMSSLYMEFRRHAKKGESFGKYLESIGFVDPSVEVNGMDDQVLALSPPQMADSSSSPFLTPRSMVNFGSSSSWWTSMTAPGTQR
jgi:hypothetical protein